MPSFIWRTFPSNRLPLMTGNLLSRNAAKNSWVMANPDGPPLGATSGLGLFQINLRLSWALKNKVSIHRVKHGLFHHSQGKGLHFTAVFSYLVLSLANRGGAPRGISLLLLPSSMRMLQSPRDFRFCQGLAWKFETSF